MQSLAGDSHFIFFLHIAYDRCAAVLEDGLDCGDRLPPTPAWVPPDGGYEEGGKWLDGGSLWAVSQLSHALT